MRRTRHVVLPVRSWQYIGLLIVSLACLTLGLVSRDREGHAGNLAGPELVHRAPHEMDACPNSNPFTEMPSHLLTKSVNDHETRVSLSRVSSPISRPTLSRSLSLDRSSRLMLQEARERSSRNRDLRAVERLSGQRSRFSDNESIDRLRESRFRAIVQSRDARKSVEPASRNSRSRDLANRAIDRRSPEQRSFNFDRRPADRSANYQSEGRRSRSAERREINEVARRLNHESQMERSLNRRDDHRDRQSLWTIRAPSETLINRQESRDYSARRVDQRSKTRERRSRSVERREDRRNLLTRSGRIAGKDTDRNNNLDRRDRERSLENRRALLDRVAGQERRSRSSAATKDSRRDLVRSNDRRSLSRSMESANDLARETLTKRVRQVESRDERSRERRSLTRSVESGEIDLEERRKMGSHFRDQRSLDRVSPRILPEEVSRRGRLSRSQRIAKVRDSRGNVANSAVVREERSRYNLGEIASQERRTRLTQSSRSLDRYSMDRQEHSRVRDSRNHDSETRDSSRRRDMAVERRERTNRSYRSHEEQRVALQKSRSSERSFERRVPETVLERRASRERVLERSHGGVVVSRTDENSRSRRESRMADRRQERSLELRASRGKTLEKRSALDSRRSSERRIVDNSRSREESSMADRRRERSLELRASRGKTLEKRSALDSRRSSERRIVDNSRSREESSMADRRRERSLELRGSRGKTLEKRSALDSRRSSERRIVDNSRSREESRMADRRRERSLELRASRERTLEKRSALDSRRSSERRIVDNSRSREESRMADRGLERSLELRASRERTLEKRSALDSRRLSERRTVVNSRSREESRMADRRQERSLELRASRGLIMEKRSALDSRRSSERRSNENLRLTNILKEDNIRHLRQRSSNLSIKEPSSRLASLRQAVKVSRVSKQRSLFAEKTLSKIEDHERLSNAKLEQNLQNIRVNRNLEVRAKIVSNSVKDNEFLKYPMTYDFIRQAVVVALCTVYGLSLYNGKKSSFRNNVVQQMQRFMVW